MIQHNERHWRVAGADYSTIVPQPVPFRDDNPSGPKGSFATLGSLEAVSSQQRHFKRQTAVSFFPKYPPVYCAGPCWVMSLDVCSVHHSLAKPVAEAPSAAPSGDDVSVKLLPLCFRYVRRSMLYHIHKRACWSSCTYLAGATCMPHCWGIA